MSEFPEGFAVEWDGQRYAPIRTRQHIKKDGTPLLIVDWSTECPSCGQEFTLYTNLIFSSPRRRCDSCKAPGRRVRTDRKLFLRQIKGDVA
jgi:Zn finger protein HypA/HybF involved in hydrogenase expression